MSAPQLAQAGFQLGADLGNGASRIDHLDAVGLGRGAGLVGRARAFEEGRALALEAVGLARIGQARPRHRQRHVEQPGAVGTAGLHPGFQRRHAGGAQAAAAALVGVGGVGVAVADHPGATRQRRLDHLVQVLAAGGEHQQGLGIQAHRIGQHQGAQLFAQRRAAGLAGGDHLQALAAQELGDPLGMRALAGPVDPLQRDEASA